MKLMDHMELEKQVEALKREISSLNSKMVSQQQLEEQLLLADKMKALASLAGGIAHDFNNILQAILGYTQLALLNKTERDTDYKTFSEIEEIIKKGSELTGQFLAIGRKIRPRFIPLNLNESIEGIQKLLGRTFPKMIEIRLQLAGDLNRIHADKGQIEQVLINLCINARDAMVNGGVLKIATENVFDSRRISVLKGSDAAAHVCLTVSDTGCGIPTEIRDRIFEPYFTAKPAGDGTGLGLSMVRAIVKNHGGAIHCASEVGMGTEFKIFFPAVKQDGVTLNKTVQPQKDGMNNRGNETILMVDDEVEILHIGKVVLQKHGYQVITAQSGEDAINLYSDKTIDTVILDVGMPGMGGITCLKELLAKNKSAKILISSGYVSDDHVADALSLGAKAFLSKPYRIDNLLETVRRVLDGKDVPIYKPGH